MKIDTRNIVSVTEASRNLGAIIAKNETFVVVQNNVPSAAIVPIEDMERLEDLDELENDIRLMALAYDRDLTGDGERHSLDDVLNELGLG